MKPKKEAAHSALKICNDCRRLTYWYTYPRKEYKSMILARRYELSLGPRSLRFMPDWRLSRWGKGYDKDYDKDKCMECLKNIETFVEFGTCDICGKFGNPRYIRNRGDVQYWDYEGDWSKKLKNILCTGCWNRVRSLEDRVYLVEQNRKLINKLKREIAQCLKSKQQASCESS